MGKATESCGGARARARAVERTAPSRVGGQPGAAANQRQSKETGCGGYRNRTDDLLGANQTLSQLS